MGGKESNTGKRFNVAVLGAAGGIGQPLSLLLSTSPYVKKLSTCAYYCLSFELGFLFVNKYLTSVLLFDRFIHQR